MRNIPDITPTVLMVVSCCLTSQIFADTTETCNMKYNKDLDDKSTLSWLFQDLQLRNSSSKLDCASRCFQERSCVTFMFNENLGLCRMYTSRIAVNDQMMDYPGFRSYETCRSDKVLGAPCILSSDCKMYNSTCINQTCQCDYGWSYSPNLLSCVQECTVYGTEFTYFKESYLSLGTKIKLTDSQYLSPDGCANACVAYTQFTCRCFELNLTGTLLTGKSCTLLEFAPSNDVSNILSNLLSTNADFYQRQCQYVG